MGTSAESAPSPWYHNPAIVSPIIKGICGVIVAVMGYLTVLQQRPETPPGGSEDQALVASAASNFANVTPASAPQSEPVPNLLLNFAAFQEQFATPGIQPEERGLRIRQLL